MSTTESKYIYKTVYEEFTGLKPPEPKNAKPKRRRGYGHPYRMRLNMQDEAQPVEANDAPPMTPSMAPSIGINPHQPEHNTFNDTNYLTNKFKKEFRDNYKKDYRRQPRNDFSARPLEFAVAPKKEPKEGPKVTYRKRRHPIDDNDIESSVG